MPVSLPRVPGHEVVGDVVAVSTHEQLWKLGQRVGAGWHGGHCSICPRCRAGDYLTCENQDITGMPCSRLEYMTRGLSVMRIRRNEGWGIRRIYDPQV